jgi:hypothetical protein
VPEIGTPGLMSEDGIRGDGHWPQATAPILDSTPTDLALIWFRCENQDIRTLVFESKSSGFESWRDGAILQNEPEMEPHTSDYVREDHPATSIVARRELSLIALDQCGSSCLQAIDADMRICGNPN